MGRELPTQTHAQIVRLSKEGDALAHEKKYDESIIKYQAAWDLLPEPKMQWEAATWLLAAIGDAHFFNRRFEASLDAFTRAIAEGVGGLGNPFLHLRRGESLFECGRQDAAADELMRAYMGAGPEILEAEDPKYLAYLKTVAKI